MRDAVNGHLEQRQALDRGLSAGFVLSLAGHLVLAGAALGAAVLAPKPPLLNVQMGFAVPLPRGGGGTPNVEPPAPAQPTPPAREPAAAPPPEPPPKVIKPPKEPPRRGLPAADARKARTKPEPVPPPRAAAPETGRGAAGASVTPGVEFGPPGPGIPGGSDLAEDWYLAGVQRKIWLIWTQQVKTGFTRAVAVSFTILGDGSVTDVRLLESSGVSLLDLAAQRSVQSAAPFGPLPKDYGTNRYTIQAIFRPTTP